MKIRKLTDFTDINIFRILFNASIGYSNIPYEYYASGDCYAMYDKGKIVAGLCLVSGMDHLRSWLQIPHDVRCRLPIGVTLPLDGNLADITGYFITDKKYTLRFICFFIKTILFHPRKYFIYSYMTSEVGLERYYGAGRPIRIYTGKPEFLEGHGPDMADEHVEILTKWGIFRIFLSRTIKILKKSLSKR